MIDINLFLDDSSKRVEDFLKVYLKNNSNYTSLLNESMRYTLFAEEKDFVLH